MLIEYDNRQISMEFVSIEELVHRDHLLRKIDKVIDFSFIREKVKGLYCADNGRPAVDPVFTTHQALNTAEIAHSRPSAHNRQTSHL